MISEHLSDTSLYDNLYKICLSIDQTSILSPDHSITQTLSNVIKAPLTVPFQR
jgi:hypothetical protein